MFILIKDSNSNIKEIKARVPQDSILEPVLFNIYINDILTSNNTQIAMYDTTIFATWKIQYATRYLKEHIKEILEHMQK